jgi:hypothetical protein
VTDDNLPQVSMSDLYTPYVADRCIEVEELAATVLRLIDNLTDGEIIANIMLAYRHLEDAAMRLNKVRDTIDGDA